MAEALRAAGLEKKQKKAPTLRAAPSSVTAPSRDGKLEKAALPDREYWQKGRQ